MEQDQLLPQILFIGAISGLSITSIVTILFHYVWVYSGFNISPVRAIGDALSNRGYRNSGLTSLTVHLLIGSALGVAYFTLFYKFGFSPFRTILASTIIGFIHGFVVAFLIFNSINEKASTEKVRDNSPAVAIIYLVAHVFFGFTIGVLYTGFI